MSRRALGWALTLVSLSLVLATLVLGLLGPVEAGSSALLDALFLAIPVSFSVVGGLLATRRPENHVGWLCLAIGVIWSLEGAGYAAAAWAGDGGMLAAASWIGLLGALWLPAVGLTGTHLALRLPGGSLLSARWRWYSRLCTAVIVLIWRSGDNSAGSRGRGSRDREPDRLPMAPVALAALPPVPPVRRRGGGIAGIALQTSRWRGAPADSLDRVGGLLFVAAVATAFLPVLLGLASEHSAPKAVEAFAYIAFAAIPAAIGVSVLRYRLYDLDVVINRTLVYGGLWLRGTEAQR